MSTIITPPGIACFTQRLFTPGHIGKAQPGKDEEYSIVILFPEPALETPEWEAVRAGINSAAFDKFGATKMGDDAFVAKLKKKLPVKDAEEKQGIWKGFESGRKWMTLKRKKSWDRPQVVDASGHEIVDETQIFPGAVIRAGVRFYAYDNEFGTGVSVTLDMVQLLKGGKDVPRLDNRVDAKKAFGSTAVPTDAMDLTLRDMGIDPASAASGDATGSQGSQDTGGLV